MPAERDGRVKLSIGVADLIAMEALATGPPVRSCNAGRRCSIGRNASTIIRARPSCPRNFASTSRSRFGPIDLGVCSLKKRNQTCRSFFDIKTDACSVAEAGKQANDSRQEWLDQLSCGGNNGGSIGHGRGEGGGGGDGGGGDGENWRSWQEGLIGLPLMNGDRKEGNDTNASLVGGRVDPDSISDPSRNYECNPFDRALFASATSSAFGRGASNMPGNPGGTTNPNVGSKPASGSVRKGKDEDKSAADGMFDWLTGLVSSLLTSRVETWQSEGRVDKRALMAETAELVVQMLDKRSSEDSFAHRSEVSELEWKTRLWAGESGGFVASPTPGGLPVP